MMQDKLDRHPSSLQIFLATEMWERYGFYVVQSLLALYLALHFKWKDKEIYALVGSFTALTYLSPVLGGWIADHLIGQKRAVLVGAIFLFFNYLFLSLVDSISQVTFALAGISLGTGLLKPNISSLLGNEYPIGSSKREQGFTLFYMGITTGIILGTTLPSQLKSYFGWPASFISAALGMIIAFSTFAYGIHRYRIADYYPADLRFSNLIKTIVIIILLWSGAFYILNSPSVANTAFAAVVLLSLSYLIYSAKNESSSQAKQTIIIGLLCIISVMFWAFYFQMFMSLTLFISRVVNPTLFGLNFPPPYYVTIQSIGMLIFGYFLSRSQGALSLAQQGIRTANKFLLAMICMTLAFLMISLVCHYTSSTLLLPPLLFIPAYLIISVAELLLSPVGLSAITLLASRKKVSTMMGIFFVSLGIGGFLSGKLASLTSIESTELSLLDLKIHYAHSFNQLLYISLGATLICILLNWMIKYMLKRSTA